MAYDITINIPIPREIHLIDFIQRAKAFATTEWHLQPGAVIPAPLTQWLKLVVIGSHPNSGYLGVSAPNRTFLNSANSSRCDFYDRQGPSEIAYL